MSDNRFQFVHHTREAKVATVVTRQSGALLVVMDLHPRSGQLGQTSGKRPLLGGVSKEPLMAQPRWWANKRQPGPPDGVSNSRSTRASEKSKSRLWRHRQTSAVPSCALPQTTLPVVRALHSQCLA